MFIIASNISLLLIQSYIRSCIPLLIFHSLCSSIFKTNSQTQSPSFCWNIISSFYALLVNKSFLLIEGLQRLELSFWSGSSEVKWRKISSWAIHFRWGLCVVYREGKATFFFFFNKECETPPLVFKRIWEFCVTKCTHPQVSHPTFHSHIFFFLTETYFSIRDFPVLHFSLSHNKILGLIYNLIL